MALPQLNVFRHDKEERALVTLAGEIDLETAPLVRAALEQCLLDGARTIDVDLTPLTFCDCSGLNAFLHAAQRTTEAGGTLRLHHPSGSLARILDLTGTGPQLLGPPLLLGPPSEPVPAPRPDRPAAVAPAPPQRLAPPSPVLLGGLL